MNLKERLDLAFSLRKQGYNCSQCVIAAFPDIHKLPEKTAMQLSCGLGGGVGGLKQTCGVVSAMALLEGCQYEGNPTDKASVYRTLQQLAEEFSNGNESHSTICEVLKSPGAKVPCNELIRMGITIYHNHLKKGQ